MLVVCRAFTRGSFVLHTLRFVDGRCPMEQLLEVLLAEAYQSNVGQLRAAVQTHGLDAAALRCALEPREDGNADLTSLASSTKGATNTADATARCDSSVCDTIDDGIGAAALHGVDAFPGPSPPREKPRAYPRRSGCPRLTKWKCDLCGTENTIIDVVGVTRRKSGCSAMRKEACEELVSCSSCSFRPKTV